MYRGMTEQDFRHIVPIDEPAAAGNCWASALSMLLRCHGADFSCDSVTGVLAGKGYGSVNAAHVRELTAHFNRALLPGLLFMGSTERWQGHLHLLLEFAPIMIHVDRHFVLVLGRDERNGDLTYVDPWDAAVRVASPATFTLLGGSGLTIFLKRI